MDENRRFRALDGSMITELVHPSHDDVKNLSLAEAVVEPGQSTYRHRHAASEEIYYVLGGQGQLYIDGEVLEMKPGTAHLIPPETEHRVSAFAGQPLRFLCVSSPPYSDSGTDLTGRVEV